MLRHNGGRVHLDYILRNVAALENTFQMFPCTCICEAFTLITKVVGDLTKVIKEANKAVNMAEEKSYMTEQSHHFMKTLDMLKEHTKSAEAVEVGASM